MMQVEAIRGMLVVCGPSGVGKGTLISRLMSEHPDKFGFSVSHTTRAPRPGEEDGVHYHFSDRATMQAAIAQVRLGLLGMHFSQGHDPSVHTGGSMLGVSGDSTMPLSAHIRSPFLLVLTNALRVHASTSQGAFLEFADVHSNMYGTSLEAVAAVGRSGRIAVLDIDVQVGAGLSHGSSQCPASITGRGAAEVRRTACGEQLRSCIRVQESQHA